MSRIIHLDRVGVAALVFLSVSACGGHRNRPGSGAAGTESSDAGSDVGGASANPGGGGAGAGGNVGGNGPGAGGDGMTTTPPEGSCLTDANCDDGLFCNGREQCRSQVSGSDVKVCMAPERGPCGSDACDEAAKACDCSRADQDDDGFRVEGCLAPGEKPDCDDSDRNRNPALQEFCDLADAKHDEDCNDTTYAGAEADDDGDGFLNAECGNYSRYQRIGASLDEYQQKVGSDCADDDPESHPGAPEVCDGLDNNCDGTADELWGTPLEERKRYYKDADGDHWGDTAQPFDTSCNIPPLGYVPIKGDCNDANPQVAPGRAEICNGYDDNCDEITDQPLTPGTLMLDEPYDGVTEFECKGEPGWSVATCPPGRLNCDENYLDACETIGTTLCNCHACGNTCQFSCGAEDCAEIQAISGGLLHTCLLVQSSPDDGNGTVACMGKNTTGQLGLGTTKDASTAAAVPGLVGVTGVATGNFHSCAVTAAGRGYCWGKNDSGQLGSGSAEAQSNYPVLLRAINDRKVERVAAGAFHGCAIYEGGSVACWGMGSSGQLGNGYKNDLRSPDRVVRLLPNGGQQSVTGASQVVAGYEHSCALSSGMVTCWGSNQDQQLGSDPTEVASSSYATPVPGLEQMSVDEIAAAAVNTCARSGTRVYCWGGNASHQLAHDQGPMGPVVPIPLPDDIVGIAVGPQFACALSEGGEIRCWGTDVHGERGPAEQTRIEPTLVPLDGAKRIFSGNGNHVCALKPDGNAWCWGKNDFGQLGNGASSPQPQPLATRISALDSAQLCP